MNLDTRACVRQARLHEYLPVHRQRGLYTVKEKEELFMSRLSTFQQNNLFVGTQLAAELPCLYPERRAFVVIGAYIQTSQGVLKPSKALNADRSDIRFWIRKYEIEKSSLEKDLDITDDNLIDSIYLSNIHSLEELESELEKYIQDFSLMEVAWKVGNPLP